MEPDANETAVSGIGTVAAARVKPKHGEPPFIAVSMHARWMRPQRSVPMPRTVGYSPFPQQCRSHRQRPGYGPAVS